MNVLEASKRRIERIFNDFEYVYVSFSGGKDSGVLLNLVLDYVREHNITHRFGVFHIDYEAQYQLTTDYVARTLDYVRELGCDVYHICLPIAAQCATSMHQSYWIPWDTDAQELWVREMPVECINESNAPRFFKKTMWDYDLQERFGGWIKNQKKVKSVACLVGIRQQESLNRWRAIERADRIDLHKGLKWTRKVENDVYNAYPIYDWKTEDVWIANARHAWDYNRLYDLMHYAGLSIHQMRVASPFNDSATESLHLYRTIDPDTWGKMVGRVNGVNFTGIYGGTTAMGWKKITKPSHFTWKQHLEFLLGTLPEQTANAYREKFETSIKFWKTRGGVLSDETITEARKSGAKVEVGKATNYKTTKLPVRFEEYPDDLPEVEDFKSVPSYKRMCVCILKNDHYCKYMGFSTTREELDRRDKALKKYQGL